MKQIELSKTGKKYKGLFALVDDADYEVLNQYNWSACRDHNTFYAVRYEAGKTIKMHHELIGKPLKGFVTDHKDRNGLNNQRENIWHCTHKENTINSPHIRNKIPILKQKKLVNPFTGVWKTGRKKNPYRAMIKRNKKIIHLGVFKTKEEAHQEYLKYKKH